MSGHEDELQRVSTSSTERGKARRFLFGSCLLFPSLGMVQWTEDGPLHWLASGLVILGFGLMLSRPKDSGIVMIPSNLRRIVRLAGLPELETTVVVYTCVVAGLISAVVGFIVFLAAT